jgi:hypothetical protein
VKPYPIQFYCTFCYEDVEIEQFDGRCKCWYCGRWIRAVHDCCYSEELGSDCYDYTQIDEDEGE